MSALTTRTLCALLLAIFASGCASSPPPAGEELALVFLDSQVFDRRLQTRMREGRHGIVVDFPAQVTTNDLPERLDAWLAAVDRQGGSVETIPSATSRGGEVVAIELGIAAARRLHQSRRYGPAKGYDARVFYDPDTGEVARVEFVRRGAGGED